MARILIALIYCISIIGLGHYTSQSSFNQILFFFVLAFICYGSALSFKNRVRDWLILAVVLRVILIFTFPTLSDDIYRFYWDGLLSINGYNPYLYLPSEVLTWWSGSGLDQALLSRLNSPDYYTVYPSISQAVYFVGAFIFPSSIYGASIIMKLILLAAELGTFYYLYKLLRYYKLPEYAILLYALNPLVIVETFGNLHFEGFMFFFFIASIYYLLISENKGYLLLASFLYACSIATKLHVLMLFPFVVLFIRRDKRWLFLIVTIICTSILLSPLLFGIGAQAFASSLDLYFRNFEFNGSIYYFARWIGYKFEGYNLISVIGPGLSICTLLGLGVLWLRSAIRKTSLSSVGSWSVLLMAFILFLFMSTTIHPWYLIVPIGLGVFTKFRFVLIWSFLITLTYINYAYPAYNENLWVVGLEYTLIFGILLFELYKIIIGPRLN